MKVEFSLLSGIHICKVQGVPVNIWDLGNDLKIVFDKMINDEECIKIKTKGLLSFYKCGLLSMYFQN